MTNPPDNEMTTTEPGICEYHGPTEFIVYPSAEGPLIYCCTCLDEVLVQQEG